MGVGGSPRQKPPSPAPQTGGGGISPLNSFLRKSMKWARPTGSSRSSRKLKPHRSTRSFVGTATLGEGWVSGARGLWGGWHSWEEQLQTPSPVLSSLGCIHGPVGVIICDPGVAGQAPRHDGVMRAMLTAELQVPGGGDGARGQCREGLWVKGTRGRVWALGLGSRAATPIPLTPQGRQRTSPGSCPGPSCSTRSTTWNL